MPFGNYTARRHFRYDVQLFTYWQDCRRFVKLGTKLSMFQFFWVFYSLSLLINSCSFREIYFGYSNFSSSARTRFVFIFVLKRVVAPRCLLFKGSKSFNRVLPLQLLPKLTFETNIVDRKYEFLGQLKWCNKQEGECSSPLIGLACEHNF